MQESKTVLNARGLRAAFNSLMKAHKNAVQHIDPNHLGTRNVLEKVVEPCVKTHAENPKFPVKELQENINKLREAVEAGNVHKVHACRELLESLFSDWAKKPCDIIIGS
jgi:hypothetical protein